LSRYGVPAFRLGCLMVFVVHVFNGLGHGVGWSGRVGRWRGGEVAGLKAKSGRVGRWVFTPWNMFNPGARWDAKKTAGLPLTRAEINN
jgi:hypothetical protein